MHSTDPESRAPGASRPLASLRLITAYRACVGQDLIQEGLVSPSCGILAGPLHVEDDELGRAAMGLATQDAPHPLDHLSSGPAGRDDDPEVGIGQVHALVKNLRGDQRLHDSRLEVPRSPSCAASDSFPNGWPPLERLPARGIAHTHRQTT